MIPTKRLTLNSIVRRLHALGHCPEFPVLTDGFFHWVLEDLGATLIRRYQEFHGLPAGGAACPATLEHLRAARRIEASCGIAIAPASVPAAAQVVASSAPGPSPSPSHHTQT